MQILFKTNLDKYSNKLCFPTLDTMDAMPRIGETINVISEFYTYYRDMRHPTSLQVVNVTWAEKAMICELSYSDIDFRTAKVSGINLF